MGGLPADHVANKLEVAGTAVINKHSPFNGRVADAERVSSEASVEAHLGVLEEGTGS